MATMNKVFLIGRLGRDPELKRIPSGTAITSFSIATSESYKDKSGEWQKRTEWHNIVVWGKQGENCEKYLKKGSEAMVEGRLQTRSWDDRDGNKRYRTEIVAENVQFLGSRQSSNSSSNSTQQPPAFEAPAGGDNVTVDDDLPF